MIITPRRCWKAFGDNQLRRRGRKGATQARARVYDFVREKSEIN